MIITKLAVAPAYGQRPQVVRDVRAAIAQSDYAAAEARLSEHKAAQGVDAAYLEALSWMGRGKLAAKDYDSAESYAEQTRKQALALLAGRKLDDDNSLPIALGASIEVQSQALNARGQKTEAVAFLQTELRRWRDTSIRTRIQKNLNLISLKGKRAPALAVTEYVGPKPQPLTALRGRPVILFFWAHWCEDCKRQVTALSKLAREYAAQGLAIVGPTQTYGYVEGGNEAPRDEEVKYIDAIRSKYYARVEGMSVPVSEENFKAWGASTTPTLVLIDRLGVVRLYHPGWMTYEDLAPHVTRIAGK
jgi:thiol-disulfide isomerase/thioredoxin